MGLLDDAIREHLELKKRHGASDEEVTRLESEVFGPGRLPPQVPAPQAAPDPAPEAVAEPPAPMAPEPEIPEPREPEPEPAPAPVEEPPPREPGPAAQQEQPPAPPPAARQEPEPWLDDPDEVPAEESLEHREPQTSEEDVLEETPDFLQETPDHERLWFEQRPPRDFDFDK
jgi:hypothetical protein